MNLKISYFIGVFVICQVLVCQQSAEIIKNLIPNGSFENYRKKSGSIKQAIPWQQIATVDFYQEAVSNDTSINRGARTGSCYAGVRFQKKYKEFLQIKLAEPLHRGTTYDFEMHVRLGFWSNAVLKSFGALFSKIGYKSKKDAVKAFSAQLAVPNNLLLDGIVIPVVSIVADRVLVTLPDGAL